MKTRRFWQWTCSVIVMCLTVIATVQAQTYQDGDFEYAVSGGDTTITGYTGVGGDVVIPAVFIVR